MGTFLGNLQVLDASETEIGEVLPKAVVGRWSERFVTAMEDSFAYGSVDRFSKKLSKQLPQATVLGVGLIDSDAVELTVYMGGKRITDHRGEYEGGPSKKGDPKKFCAALGLPEEDIPRLKAVWAKGDAEEQLELTAALLGAPLWCRVDWPPEKQAVRDVARVDRWLAERPDPPKVKNQTRAELLQELTDVMIESRADFRTNENDISLPFTLHHVDSEGWFHRNEDEYCRFGPNGTVERVGPRMDPRSSVDRLTRCAGSLSYDYLKIGDGRILGLSSWRQGVTYHYCEVEEDSAGALRVPFSFTLDGERREFDRIWSMEDGGILVWYRQLNLGDCQGPRTPFDLVRYAADGTVLWRRQFGSACGPSYSSVIFWDHLLWVQGPEDFFSVDLDGKDHSHIAVPTFGSDLRYEFIKRQKVSGQVWLTEEKIYRDPFYTVTSIVRFDPEGTMLRKDPLPDGVSDSSIFLGLARMLHLPDCVLICGHNEGIWKLDSSDLSVKAWIRDHRAYWGGWLDGKGRIWVIVGGSTMESYDLDLKLLSRHKLKGQNLSNVCLDSEGCLCVGTYDDRRHVIRAYRLS